MFFFLFPVSNNIKKRKKLKTLPTEIAYPQLLVPISGVSAISFA